MKLFLKNLLFTILVPGTVAVYAPLLITRGRGISNNPILLLIGILLLVMGSGVYLWTVWNFATEGRGTPLPIDSPSRLVESGLYRYTRNPMYIGVILVILGWACLFADGWILLYALGVGAIVHLFVVYYEEPRLQELFGEEYIAYRRSVGRWVPRIPLRRKIVGIDNSYTPSQPVKTKQRRWIRIIIIALICEKIIQHILVTLAFYHNWSDIRSDVAVNPDYLMVLGGIVAVLFVLSLWGMLNRRKWVNGLLIGLALFDIIGEFVAQGMISIVITVSFLVATLLLILTLVYRRQVMKEIDGSGSELDG